MSIGNDIRNTFTKSENGLVRLIIINVIVFVLANVFNLFYDLTSWLALPSKFSVFITRPWTLFTYMFFHKDIFHVLFNMLWLYWMGQLFVDFMSSKRLVSVYILGGVFGGLLYFLLSGFMNVDGSLSLLLGASASVMAIVVAIAVFIPNYSLHLLFFGPVPIKYIALISFVITTLLDLNVNTGGKVAHIGGALLGIIYTFLYKQGNDITRPLTFIIDKLKSLPSGSRPAKLKVAYKKQNTYKTNTEQQKEVDEILDKISRSGYESLTKEEKEILFKASGK